MNTGERETYRRALVYYRKSKHQITFTESHQDFMAQSLVLGEMYFSALTDNNLWGIEAEDKEGMAIAQQAFLEQLSNYSLDETRFMRKEAAEKLRAYSDYEAKKRIETLERKVAGLRKSQFWVSTIASIAGAVLLALIQFALVSNAKIEDGRFSFESAQDEGP
jgi:hypothetical protein